MKTALKIPEQPPLSDTVWKDEMNFSEFPLTLLSDRTPAGLESLQFEVHENDGRTVRRVSVIPPNDETLRQLIRAACPDLKELIPVSSPKGRRGRKSAVPALPAERDEIDQYLQTVRGLPTTGDEDILLAMIQLSRLDGFKNRNVPFSVYEILKLLGWSHSGKSHERVITSLLRWKAILLTYADSWRDNVEKKWVTRTFNVLDEVIIYSGSGRRSAKEVEGRQGSLLFSSFTWNETIFKSFQGGYLKNLNFEVYKALKSRIGKRIYRFLDKCFYRHPEGVSFDLLDFAGGHVGLIGNYQAWKVKQLLRPAIEELEIKRIIRAVPEAERYSQEGRGCWRIRFEPAGTRVESETIIVLPAVGDAGGIESLLVKRGVGRKTASDLIAQFPAEEIEAKIDVLDWLLENPGEKPVKNPPAYLVKSLLDGFQPPAGYVPKADRESKRQRAEEERQRREDAKQRREQTELRKMEAASEARKFVDDHVENYLAGLTGREKAEFIEDAFANFDSPMKSYLRSDGAIGETLRKTAVEKAVLAACPLPATAQP